MNIQAKLERLVKDLYNPTSKDFQIGIWGTARAGKTTYLTTLYNALMKSNRWYVEADDLAINFVKEQSKRLQKRVFPMPTELANPDNPEIFTYELTPRLEPSPMSKILPPPAKVVLSFIDAPGECYEDLEGVGSKILDYLSDCHGIIFLLDPFRAKEENKTYDDLLLDLCFEFQKRKRKCNLNTPQLQQYMSFCVTKIDQDQTLWNAQDSSDIVRQVIGQEMFTNLQENFAMTGRLNCYGVSAIGCHKNDKGKWQTNLVLPQRNGASPEIIAPKPAIPAYGWSNPDSDFATPLQPAPSRPQPKAAIRSDVILEPRNVLEPLEWLIQSIQSRPPILISKGK